MLGRVFVLLGPLLVGCSLAAGCGAQPPSDRLEIGPVAASPTTAPPVTSVPATASASASASVAATPAPGLEKGKHRISLAMKSGAAPCTLVLTAEQVEMADVWFFRSVTRIEAEASECAQAQLLFDGAQTDPDREPMPMIPALFWVMPGHTLPAEVASDVSPISNGLIDLNGDGALDLCSVIDEVSARSQQCWVYEPTKRVFVYHPELAEVPHLLVTGGKLGGWRHAGHVHESLDYSWIDGKAELTRRSTEFLGSRPDFTPTPGRAFLVVEQIRKGKVISKTQREVPYDP